MIYRNSTAFAAGAVCRSFEKFLLVIGANTPLLFSLSVIFCI